MAVILTADVLSEYERFSLYNSPYVAHDHGHAIDLYPNTGLGPATDGESSVAPSPVAGEILDVRTVRAPPKPHATEYDCLVLVDTGEHIARVLHVEPTVEPGDTIEIGESLGTLIRAGFFASWVDNHVHLEFRNPDVNPYRASGSLPLTVDVPLAGLPWDGAGTVIEIGETYVVLDSPTHPAPGEYFVGIAADEGPVIDGGLVHYTGGGTHNATEDGPISLLGQRVGHASGHDVTWDSLEILANGKRITGLSLFCGREADFGAKLVCPDHAFSLGERIEVDFRANDDPIRLG